MSAIREVIDCPLDCLREMIRHLIDEINRYNIEKVAVPVNGSLNSAIATHIAERACDNSNSLLSIITVKFKGENNERAENVANTAKCNLHRLLEIAREKEPSIVKRYTSFFAADTIQAKRGLVINTDDLTDYFIGPPKPSSDEYPLLKWLLKSEIEKLGREIVDWIGKNPEEGESEEQTKARQSAIDNCIVQQENPQYKDYKLAVILAAKETNCDLLLKAHQEDELKGAFNMTKMIRQIENFDYNKLRAVFLGNKEYGL